MEKIIYLECDCGSEIMKVEKDEEIGYMVAIYNYGNYRRNLWTRIKYCWRILTKDKVFGDQIILSPEKAKTLSKFIENE